MAMVLTVVSLKDCTLSDEEIALGLKTMNANAYNFFADLPSSQNYTVTATAMLDTCAGSAMVDDSADSNFGGCMNGEDAGTWAEAYNQRRCYGCSGSTFLIQT